MSSLENKGHFLEDFDRMGAGHIIVHPNPMQIDAGVVAGHKILAGQGFAVFNSPAMNGALDADGAYLDHEDRLVDPILVFQTVFGKTVPDISLNAVANLGYEQGRFIAPVFIGDTIRAQSEVLAVKENSNGKTGIVAVRTTGFDQSGDEILQYTRWVMVNKQDHASTINGFGEIPKGDSVVAPEDITVAIGLKPESYSTVLSGSPFIWEDLEAGQIIEGDQATRIQPSQHQDFTRLFDNVAKVHFAGPEIVYGGFAISLARSLTARTLGNAFQIVAINGGQHINPLSAGNLFEARAEIVETREVEGNDTVGLVRLRFQAARDLPRDESFNWDGSRVKEASDPAQVLNFDVWATMPREAALTAESKAVRAAMGLGNGPT